jgi:hypothetical protein
VRRDRRRDAARPSKASLVGLTGAGNQLWWTTDERLGRCDRRTATGTDQPSRRRVILPGLASSAADRHDLAADPPWLAYGPAGRRPPGCCRRSRPRRGARAALVVGIASILVGATRRLGAPLVIGTATVAGTIAISAGPRLASAPTWTWIAGGGVALLVVAALVERSDRPVLPAGRRADGPRSILEEFCDDFG